MHEKLKGFKISINEFGEVVDNFGKDKLNYFLNTTMRDKEENEEEE